MTESELNETYRDSDMDGLPDRIDSAPTVPQYEYYYVRIEAYQADYLRSFFGRWFEICNGIVRVNASDRAALDAALQSAETLERQHEKIDIPT